MSKDIIRIALDLEYQADGTTVHTDKIIQLGYCIFNATNKQILFTGGSYVKIDEPLTPYITKLTGITQDDHDNKGISIEYAISKMMKKCDEIGVNFRQLVTWGNDADILRETWLRQSKHDQDSWLFGYTYCNIKPLFQAKMISENKNYRGGLSVAARKLGLDFIPYSETEINDTHKRQYGKHDARCDSLNTARMYLKLVGS